MMCVEHAVEVKRDLPPGNFTHLIFLSDIDPPRNFEELESTETSLTLRWQKPRAKVGAYQLVYVPKDGQAEVVEVPATATSYVLSNLTPGMTYTITLAAERGLKRSTPVTLSASTGGWGTILPQYDRRIMITHPFKGG